MRAFEGSGRPGAKTCPLVVVLDKDDVLHVTRAHFNIVMAPVFTQYLGIPASRAEKAVDDAYVQHGEIIPYLISRSAELRDTWSVDRWRALHEACNARVLNHLQPDAELNDLLARLTGHGVVFAVLTHNYTDHSRAALAALGIDRFVCPELVVGRTCLNGLNKASGTAYPFLDTRLPLGSPRVMVDDQYRNLLALPESTWSGRLIGSDPLPPEYSFVRYPRVHDYLASVCDEMGA